jgi:hypothetical protein
MQAALEGKLVETSDGDFDWEPCIPSWNWSKYDYRIAATKIAKGHNPDNLTEEQVGVKDGWRLLEPEEIHGGNNLTTEMQPWLDEGEWLPCACHGADPDNTYRTKKPKGYFLPKTQEQKDADAFDQYLYGKGFSVTLRSVWDAALQYERSRQ